MALKIAIIGGGSAYAPGVINAFIQKAHLFDSAEIALMDTAPDELEIVARLARRLVEYNKANIKITDTSVQSEAIAGADYVLSTFRQGGFEARHFDESLPLLYDIIGQETIGPGGFFFAMRSLLVIQSIINDMQELAPGAVLVNYTNPTQIIAEAVTHFSQVPCISICDQTKADLEKILHALDMQDAPVELVSVGLNHATWSTHFSINEQDGIEVMKRHLDEVLKRKDVDERVKRQFRLAIEFSRLPNSYLQYYYYRDDTLAEAKAASKTRAQAIMETLPGYYQHFKEQSTAAQPRLSHVRGGSIFGDLAVEVLCAHLQQDGSVYTLNIPNHGALPDFSPDRVVEVPARIGAGAITPIVQTGFPSELLGLLKILAEYQWTAAQAIWHWDRQKLEQALATNPLVLDLPLARRLIERILPLIREWLPDGY